MLRDATAPPMSIAEPTDAGQLCEMLAECRASQEPVRIAGGGSWMDAGRPVHSARMVSTRAMSGVVEYVPGDLVITVRAGTTLAEIAEVTAAHGQWLALDPYGSAAGTIGATVATASAGPLSTGFGRVRDLVLGVTAVTGDGVQVTAGGRVVKNVAGFDLVRLLVGSWGTLGVLTEISLRLHARPQHDETIAVRLPPSAMGPRLAALRALQASPIAVQLLDPALASRLVESDGDSPTLLVRLGGNAARVTAQRQEFASLGTVTSVDPAVWMQLQQVERELEQELAGDGHVSVIRVSDARVRLAPLVATLREACARLGHECWACASPMQGVVRLVVTGSRSVDELLTIVRAHGARVIAERLSSADWGFMPSATADPISAGIRRRFDRHELLNRGILGAPGAAT